MAPILIDRLADAERQRLCDLANAEPPNPLAEQRTTPPVLAERLKRKVKNLLAGWRIKMDSSVADLASLSAFFGVSMNYQAFTNESLTMMYERIRGALAADIALTAQGGETRFRVRETPEWKKHAAGIEKEMLRRGMMFEVIDWSEDQARLPFGE